jgi:hypothetical protein
METGVARQPIDLRDYERKLQERIVETSSL